MESNTDKLLRRRPAVRAGIWIVLMVFLGALGTGLWELALRDAMTWLGNIALMLISAVWSGYVDLLHKSIGNLRNDSLIVPIFAFVMVLMLFVPWAMIIDLIHNVSRMRKKLTDSEDKKPISLEQLTHELAAIRKRVLRTLLPMAVASNVFFAIIGWQTIYTRDAGNWAERSVEILLPYVSAHENSRLRSDLRAVESAEQFYALEKRLRDLAGKASITLPAFTVIRKPSRT